MIQRLLILILSIQFVSCTKQTVTDGFLIADKTHTTSIYVDSNCDPLIFWAAEELSKDIERITGAKPNVIKTNTQKETGIYMGEVKDELLTTLTTSNDSLLGKWEAFSIQNTQQNIVITGSDVRGTVYGIFELAEQLGVSPWQWWADVVPLKKEKLQLELLEKGIVQSPSVQYRGIFLNDEDWGLQPWAAKTFDTETGDIGPKTYEKIFQLLLRLKANTIWPAMHPCTQGFFTVEGNAGMAEKYQMIVGTSHAEPMMRNNVAEWNHDFGKYDYSTNKKRINEYWQSRITEIKEKNVNTIMTLGMRGIHDSGMEGVSSLAEGMAFVDTIMTTQRTMLSNTLEKPITQIPQVFIPYKEVLDIYDEGLKVPEDVTLMWTDDNYGYIRRLSNEEEQKRVGGSGVYYHLSYWGRPHDYLWLSTTQPGLIWHEMSRAYANGARKIWIANVGDIKPGEYGMEFFLDLAWDFNSIDESTIHEHLRQWSAREFGAEIADEIAMVMNEYYRLAFLRKPEYMGWSQTEPTTPTGITDFINQRAKDRIAAYDMLYKKTDSLQSLLPKEKLAAWFQLVAYPVKGAALMNRKFLYQQLALTEKDEADKAAYIKKSEEAFNTIEELTAYYNKELIGGKWNHMMSMTPRNLPVFDAPASHKPNIDTGRNFNVTFKGKTKKASGFKTSKGNWKTIEGLGYSNQAITLFPLSNTRFKNDQPWVAYEFDVEQPGAYLFELRCLPTHSNTFDHEIRIEIDGEQLAPITLNTKGRSDLWKENVLRNSTVVKVPVQVGKTGKVVLKVYVNQTGIVLDQVALYPADSPHFYELPIMD